MSWNNIFFYCCWNGQPQASKMLVTGSNRRMFGVNAHSGLAVTGSRGRWSPSGE